MSDIQRNMRMKVREIAVPKDLIEKVFDYNIRKPAFGAKLIITASSIQLTTHDDTWGMRIPANSQQDCRTMIQWLDEKFKRFINGQKLESYQEPDEHIKDLENDIKRGINANK